MTFCELPYLLESNRWEGQTLPSGTEHASLSGSFNIRFARPTNEFQTVAHADRMTFDEPKIINSHRECDLQTSTDTGPSLGAVFTQTSLELGARSAMPRRCYYDCARTVIFHLRTSRPTLKCTSACSMATQSTSSTHDSALGSAIVEECYTLNVLRVTVTSYGDRKLACASREKRNAVCSLAIINEVIVGLRRA